MEILSQEKKEHIGKESVSQKNAIQHFLTFLKIGSIGFGGGSALIPVVEREVVDKKGQFQEEEYTKHTVRLVHF